MGGGYRTAARSAILAAGAIAAAVGFAPMTAGAGVAEGKAALERYDYHSALAEFSDAAAGNDREAQYQLGLLYMLGHGGIPQDYARSAQWFARAAEGGHGMAAYMLANQYASGVGVGRDYPQARRLMLAAASSVSESTRRSAEASAGRLAQVIEAQRVQDSVTSQPETAPARQQRQQPQNRRSPRS